MSCWNRSIYQDIVAKTEEASTYQELNLSGNTYQNTALKWSTKIFPSLYHNFRLKFDTENIQKQYILNFTAKRKNKLYDNIKSNDIFYEFLFQIIPNTNLIVSNLLNHKMSSFNFVCFLQFVNSKKMFDDAIYSETLMSQRKSA